MTVSMLLSVKLLRVWTFVNEIAECDTDFADKPLDAQVMKKVTVDTFGEEFPEPEKC